MKGRVKAFAPGSQAWLADEKDTWQLVNVVSRYKKTLVVCDPDDEEEEWKVKLKEQNKTVFPANASVVADMTSLQYFHLPGILHNLKERSIQDEPYTFLSQSVLVAVNPLKRVSDPKGILGKTTAVNVAHPYAIAESAYQQLAFNARRAASSADDAASSSPETPVNQSIIVGGESGAGKTESSKYVLKHLVKRTVESGASDDDLDQRLIESNPILEAFGNAATKRNHNSSRFGKFMKIHYTKPSKKASKKKPMRIFGASVNTYLLERSRVTYHVSGERTYHVFYQLVHGADKKLRKKLKFDGDAKFDFLTPKAPGARGGGKQITVGRLAVAQPKKASGDKAANPLPGPEEDKAHFEELCQALGTIGVDVSGEKEGESAGLFPAVAAILHLGNLQFKDKDSSEGSMATLSDESALEAAASLLGVKKGKLLKLFCEHRVKVMNEEVVKKRDARGAKYALDAVVKALYVGLFDWLVQKITESLSEKGDLSELPFIGVLDIFGFETFKVNDFEQLLINFTNEALQSCFNQQIFQAEAQLYEREGLLMDEEERELPPDNIECVELLQGGGGVLEGKKKKKKKKKDQDKENKRPGASVGLLGLIDSESRNPQPSDDKMNAALHRAFKGHEYFPQPHPKDVRQCFLVKHYAGVVKYTVGSFLEKNTDNLPKEVNKVLSESASEVLQFVFGGAGKEKKSPSKKKGGTALSVTGKFKAQITELIDTLNETRCSFIRCIKPNASMVRKGKGDKSWFDNSYVLPQLINLSVPQTAEVLQGGLPTRIEFQMFIDTYKEMLPSSAINVWETMGQGDDRQFVKALFYAFDIESGSYKMGLTRVFFKAGMLDKVNEVLQSAMEGKKLDKSVSKAFRSYFVRVLWRRARAKVLAYAKFKVILEQARAQARAATILQRLARRRMLELEAKAELERLKIEREERKIKEAKALERQERQRLKELAKRKGQASDDERRDIEIKEALAKTKADEQGRRVKHLSLRVRESKRFEADLRRSVKMLAGSGDTRAGGALLIEDRKRKSMKALGIIEEEEEEDDDDAAAAEDDGPLVWPLGVYYKEYKPPVPKQNAARAAASTSAQVVKSAGQSAFQRLMCFSTLFKNFRTDKKAKREYKANVAEENERAGAMEEQHKDDDDDDDGFRECCVQMNGFSLKIFEDYEEDDDGKGRGVGQVFLNLSLDHNHSVTRMAEESILGAATVHVFKRFQNLIRVPICEIRFEEMTQMQDFIDNFERATNRYYYEVVEAHKLATGQLTPAMQEYKSMLDMGLITQEQFETALFSQICDSSDAPLAAEDGQDDWDEEEGLSSYRIKCTDCQNYLFNLPLDPLTECPHCGNEEIDSPGDIEKEAEMARTLREQERQQGLEQSRMAGSGNAFPFYLQTESESYEFEQPSLTERRDKYNTRNEYVYVMSWHRKIGEDEDEWDDFHCEFSFEDLKDFYTEELIGTSLLSQETERKLPDFPNDASDYSDEEEKATMRLAIVINFMLDFLKVLKSDNLLEIKQVRQFLGMDF